MMAPIEQREALLPPEPSAGTGGRGGLLVGRLADPDRPMPLDVLGRYERALAQGHRSNLLRLAVIEERVLALPEE